MNHDELIDLLGAYALDAVDADERALLDEHLATCAQCRADVRAHREVAALLAHTGGDAPAGLWERLEQSLDEPPPGLRLVRAPESGRDPEAGGPVRAARHTAAPRWAWGVVAAAAVIVAVLGVQVRNQGERIDELRAQMSDPMEPGFLEAMEAPHSQLVELASDDGEVVVRGAITEDGWAYLNLAALPRLDAEHTYQLWGAAGDELVSIAVVGAEPTIIKVPAEGYALFALTQEVSSGVVTSQQAPVVAGGPA